MTLHDAMKVVNSKAGSNDMKCPVCDKWINGRFAVDFNGIRDKRLGKAERHLVIAHGLK